MIGDLFINGYDAYRTWGVRMGEGFISTLLTPAPLKELIENKSRLENGKRIIYNSVKIDDRNINLPFTIEGRSMSDHMDKYNAFIEELQKGKVRLKVPALGDYIYTLVYLKSVSYNISVDKTFSKLAVAFNEPDPSNR